MLLLATECIKYGVLIFVWYDLVQFGTADWKITIYTYRILLPGCAKSCQPNKYVVHLTWINISRWNIAVLIIQKQHFT